jgi:hypothetical protein
VISTTSIRRRQRPGFFGFGDFFAVSALSAGADATGAAVEDSAFDAGDPEAGAEWSIISLMMSL